MTIAGRGHAGDTKFLLMMETRTALSFGTESTNGALRRSKSLISPMNLTYRACRIFQTLSEAKIHPDPFIRVAIPAAHPPDNFEPGIASRDPKHRADKVISA